MKTIQDLVQLLQGGQKIDSSKLIVLKGGKLKDDKRRVRTKGLKP